MEGKGQVRQIVIPGETVGAPGMKPGPGTFREGGRIHAALLGVLSERDGVVSVIPISGRYIPEPGDAVIGEVVDMGPSHWLVDINSPYPAPLHATESPWDIEFGDTSRYMNVGDAIMAHVLSVDEAKTTDPQNPWRTDGWVVVKEEAVRRMVIPPELVEHICKSRVCFVPDDAWDKLGLPRGSA